MPTITLGEDEYTAVEYWLRKPGLVELEVHADLPVKTYVVGPKALARFEEGSKDFKYWGGFPDPRTHQKQKVWIHFRQWYLIIWNPSRDEEADVNYEVFY